MAKVIIEVRQSKESPVYELSAVRPDSLNDTAWEQWIGGTEEERRAALSDLAWQQLVVKAQAAVRGALTKGERNKDRLQAVLDGYKYRGGPVRSAPVSIDAASLFAGFLTKDGKVKEEFLAVVRAQLDALTASGATVVNIPANVAGVK
jgi:hypothetical protein